MVGVVHAFDGHARAVRILRNDVLESLYGKAATGARRLIDASLEMYEAAADAAGIEAVGASLMGLHAGELRATTARTQGELLRDAALLYSSLANLDRLDEPEESDVPQQEDVSKRFGTEVREQVVGRRPDLELYFGRSAVLVDGGDPVRFGFCSARAVLHFGVLHPVRQPASVRDARAKLWELSRAMDIGGQGLGALIFAVPRDDDPLIGQRQRESLQKNRAEIEREADQNKMRFLPVTSVEDGAARVIEFA
jgi:hypothetical protein